MPRRMRAKAGITTTSAVPGADPGFELRRAKASIVAGLEAALVLLDTNRLEMVHTLLVRVMETTVNCGADRRESRRLPLRPIRPGSHHAHLEQLCRYPHGRHLAREVLRIDDHDLEALIDGRTTLPACAWKKLWHRVRERIWDRVRAATTTERGLRR